MRRKKSIEPKIEPEEIERLRTLLAREEELEWEMRQDMREAIKASDKRLLRELHRLENKNRRLLLWIGVTIVMLIIIVFWVSRFDSLIVRPPVAATTSNFDLSSTGLDMQNTVKSVLQSIEEIKTQAKQLDAAAVTDSPAVFPDSHKVP